MYSQNNEEEILCNLYAELQKSGKPLSNTILDIGANDGKTLSNSRGLIEKFSSISGFLVEPNPDAFDKLKRVYQASRHQIFDFAIGEQAGTMELLCNGAHLTEADTGLLSTLVPTETERWVENEKWESKQVKVVTYPFHHLNFDIISIDAEGMDEVILTQINLSFTYILCIEWNSKQDFKERVVKYCAGFGMGLYTQNAENLIFTKND